MLNLTSNSLPVYSTMFMTRPVKEIMKDAANAAEPIALVPNLWNEGELACLFAESNVGKSIFAVQIAENIATTQRVLYFDCELSDRQFQVRYSDSETSQVHEFPENLLRATIAPERLEEGDFCENFLRDLEIEAMATGAKVIILDNLSYACITSEKGDDAGKFMLRLKRIQMMHGWSILVIAHTPKKEPYTPINANDLAGSKKLFNFFDSVFAIGKSRGDDGFRYLKQLKYRVGEFTYTDENVGVFELVKGDDGNLMLHFQGFDEEYNQLFRSTAYDSADEEVVVELRKEGLSVRAIAEETGISRSSVQRILKRRSTSEPRLKEEIVS